MECPICFNIIENSCVAECMHHFCYTCLIKWIEYNDICPTCKTPVLEIKLDKEFDNINNPECSILVKEVTKKINVDFSDGSRPGITIGTNKSGPGVKIVNLVKHDKCYKSGLRIGDVILFMNMVPCYGHHQAIKVVKNACDKERNLLCELLIIKK